MPIFKMAVSMFGHTRKKVQYVNKTIKLGPIHVRVPVHVSAVPNYGQAFSMFGY